MPTLADISFTPEALADKVKRAKVGAGRHATLLTDFTPWVKANAPDEKDDIAIHVKLKVLKDPEKGASLYGPAIRFYMKVPVDNPMVEGHVGPTGDQISQKFVQLMHAMFPDKVPDYPRYDKATSTVMYKGEVLERDTNVQEAAAAEALALALTAFAPLWGTAGEELKAQIGKHVLFIDLGYPEKGDFAFWRELSSDGEDWDLRTDIKDTPVVEEDDDDDDDDDDDAPPPPVKKKKVAKKAARRPRR